VIPIRKIMMKIKTKFNCYLNIIKIIIPAGVTIPNQSNIGFLPYLSIILEKMMLPTEKLRKLIPPIKPTQKGSAQSKFNSFIQFLRLNSLVQSISWKETGESTLQTSWCVQSGIMTPLLFLQISVG
jgi:hypothetical protein